jgi:thymidine phosphorylase
MDVKCGNGAFCTTRGEARALARSLIEVAHGASLPTTALVTDMNQVLGRTAGNALEVAEAIDFLAGRGPRETRLDAVTLALAGEMLALSGLAPDAAAGTALARRALDSGAAAERFARMVAALGGPRDVLTPRGARLPTAHVLLDVAASRAGVLAAMDTRAIGLAVIDLGGGRRVATDAIDPAVGLSHVLPCGSRVTAGQPLMRVHARSRADAQAAVARLQRALVISDATVTPTSAIFERLAGVHQAGKPRASRAERAS